MKKVATISILLVLYAAYSSWIYTSGTAIAATMTTEAMRGKQLWQRLNCQTCHQLYGLGGYMGPDLTTVITDKGRGAAYARGMMLSGGRQMPNYHLSVQDADMLLAYLSYVNGTQSR
ncbi:MAG: cytochrome c [Taibaiella sp.]|nr:cytochrome c [Taibaiella sp.]